MDLPVNVSKASKFAMFSRLGTLPIWLVEGMNPTWNETLRKVCMPPFCAATSPRFHTIVRLSVLNAMFSDEGTTMFFPSTYAGSAADTLAPDKGLNVLVTAQVIVYVVSSPTFGG